MLKKILLFFPLLNANITPTLEFVDNEFASIKIGEFNFNARLRARQYSSVSSLPSVHCPRDPYWLTNRDWIGIGLQREKLTREQMSVRKRSQTIRVVLKTCTAHERETYEGRKTIRQSVSSRFRFGPR